MDPRDKSNLSGKGLYFRESGQVWAFQDHPIGQLLLNDNSINENSDHDDSSSVVGEPSSGDEARGSEFESSADDSDVIITTSSDEESGVENSH